MERVQALRKAMKKQKIDCFLVTNLLNIEYLTNVKASVAMMIVGPKNAELFIDERYLEQAKKIISKGVKISSPRAIQERIGQSSVIGIESDSLPTEKFLDLKSKYKNKKIVHTFDLIKGLRRFKNTSEIKQISKACSITKSVLKMIPHLLKPGMTEKELSWLIHAECMKKGASGMAFDTIVGFASHTSSPHHHPTERKYSLGDLVQIDMGAMYGSYCSDYSRIYGLASLNDAQKKCYRALTKAKKEVEKMLKPGVSTHALDKKARSILRAYGYDEEFCHALGHGVGMEIHEGVVLSQKRPNEKLKKGDVITIEPGLYFPGHFGMRIEDTHII